MKKIFLILVLAVLMPWCAQAQDGRNRTPETIVADAMAQLPAQNQSLYNELMADLAGTGAQGVVQLADMLVPAARGQNAAVEYALNGLVAYVTKPGREAEAQNVRAGLVKAIGACQDKPNKSFLMSLLGLCGTAEDSEVLVPYLNDSYFAEPALHAITSFAGSEKLISSLILQSEAPNAALARSAAAKGISDDAVESRIIEWAQVSPVGQRKDFYHAMSRIGTQKSLKLLEKAAKSAGYVNDADDATEAYTVLLSSGLGKGFDAQLLKSAKQLLKSNAPVYVRGAALAPVFELEGKKALPELVKALKSGDRQYRVNALRLCEPWADDEVYGIVNNTAAKSGNTMVMTDVMNWFGTNHVSGQLPAVITNMTAADAELAASAIKAVAKIGGADALDALVGLLGTPSQKAAMAALLHFNGDITPGVDKALDSDSDDVKVAALQLAAKRHIHAVSPKVFALLSGNSEITNVAYGALAGVVTTDDFDKLAKLAASMPADKLANVSYAMMSALAPVPSERQYEILKPYVTAGGDITVYYHPLALCGTKDAVQILKDAYAKGDRNAFDALLMVEGNDMIPVLYDIAAADKTLSASALKRYAALVKKSGYNQAKLYDLFSKGIAASDDAEVQKLMLSGLAQSNVFPAITLAAGYIDNPATAAVAAEAVRSIASKNNFVGDEVVKALEAAKAYYVAEGSADSGYAVDDINGIITRCSNVPVFKLSPEEEAEGFEVLFDGTSMERWTGNKTAYTPLDGAIYVTAQYGGSGNLYTDKEYSDFIYRFEFCFDRPGVNNGVGIRTPQNVDAAYHGMEIQILDHDDPIYKNLRPYQVHGSVYGIIPAKRIVSPEQGVWNTEEIRAVGDRITVTVNGEVILDGNIRNACKGHNVAKDSKTNPYTVDKLNHPGLFNKKGYISFCGHGPGIKFRNIRIKDLSKK